MPATFVLLAATLLSADPGATTAWDRFRGPNGSGVSAADRLPDALDPEGNLVWRTEVAAGYSSPVLDSERAYLTGADETGLATFCFDRITGEPLWRAAAPGEPDKPYGGPNARASSTSATDGERVVSFFRHFGLVCHDTRGKELWRHPLTPLRVPHGASTSPILADGLVLLQCDQDGGSYLLALDARSGEPRWKAERPGITHCYSTPIVHKSAEGEGEVVLSGAYRVEAYSLAKGERLWWVDGMCWMPTALPVDGAGLIFVSSVMGSPSEYGAPEMPERFELVVSEHDGDGDGRVTRAEWQDEGMQMLWFILDIDGDDVFEEEDWRSFRERAAARGGFFAIEPEGRGDVTSSRVRWSDTGRRGVPSNASPLVHENVLYLLKEGGVLTSLDPKTGEVKKRARVGEPDEYYASPVGGDGKLFLAGHSGQLAVVRAGAEWEELAVHNLGELIWGTPALAEGWVVVRTDEALYGFGLPEED